MMVQRIGLPAIVLAFIFIAACTAAPAVTPTPEVTEPPATATPTPTGTPAPPTPDVTEPPASPAPPSPEPGSPQPGTGVTGDECEGMPTFLELEPDQNPFTPDEQLEALFPTQVAGQPVSELTSFRWLEFMCLIGGQQAVDGLSEEFPAGFDMRAMSMATAQVEVEGQATTLSALRMAGINMQAAFQLELLGLLAAPGEEVPDAGDFEQVNLGGKSVYAFESEGEAGYMYPSADVLWFVGQVTEEQAEQILAALP